MNVHDATEQTFKNGYEHGFNDAAEQLNKNTIVFKYGMQPDALAAQICAVMERDIKESKIVVVITKGES